MEMIEKQISSKTLYDGRIFRVTLDEIKDVYGNDNIREVVIHNGGVGVVALDDDDRVLMIRQYRYGAGEVLLEIPAGKLELGEQPMECGLRELIEETGYKANKCIDLGFIYPTPAYDTEKIYLYYASDLEFVGQHFDSGEYMECEKIALDEVVKMIMEGKITDAKTIAAVMKISGMRKK